MAYSYKVMGKTVTLDVDPGAVAVRFKDDLPKSARADAVEEAGAGPFGRRYEVPNEKITIVPVVDTPGTLSRFRATIGALNDSKEVEQALPVFRVDGNQVVAVDRVVIGFEDEGQTNEIAERYRLRPVRRWDDTIVFEAEPDQNVFDLATKLSEEAGVRFAEPDLITIGRHIPRRTAPLLSPMLSDPLVPQQYAMTLTRAVDAWALQQGDPEIVIAILDEGVDSLHPDLKPAIVGTYDAIDGDTYQEPNSWDGHGTACAGLAAAVPNNAVGIRGVGGGCSLHAVRIARSDYSGGPWITSNQAIAAAINWAWKQEASVISNSWGGGAPSNAIIQEFEKARTQGRGGLGCVIVIAAGNDFREVSFPGNLSNVLTVAASNQWDEAKTPTSADGETWWGTNHGPEIDVAAPGVANMTTDIRAGGGYDQAGDYDAKFNGTSSACPIVAGACGLVLSAAPGLKEEEVRQIIGASADKVGPHPYAGGRNDFFGKGRLNVLKAVEAARAQAGQGAAAAPTVKDGTAEPALG